MTLPEPLASWWLALKGAWSVIRTGLFLAAVGGLCLYSHSCGRQASAAEIAALKVAHAQALAESATQLARLATEYRETERRMGADFIDAATKHTEEMRRANVQSNAVLAGLRAGTLRLQKHWAGSVSTPSAATGDPGAVDDAAERRATDTATLVGIGAEFDAFAALCHRTLTAERHHGLQ